MKNPACGTNRVGQLALLARGCGGWALAALVSVIGPGLQPTAQAQDGVPAAQFESPTTPQSVDEAVAPPFAEPAVAADADAHSPAAAAELSTTANTGLAPVDTAPAAEEAPRRRSPFEGTRIAVGGRVGYGLGLLDVVDGRELSSAIDGIVPLVFDAAPRFRNGTEVGLYAQLAFGIPAAGPEACDDCSIFGFRLGAQINQHFNSGGTVDPWIGAGIGFDWLTVSQSSTVQGVTNSGTVRDVRISRSTTYRALPEGVVQAGIDFGGDQLAIGPFVSFSLATYSSAETEVECHDLGCPREPLASSSTDIADERRTPHAWLLFGIHGNYLL